VYKNTGQYAKAEALYQRSLKIYEAKLEPDHPRVAASLNNLAGLYQGMGQYTKAEPLHQRSLKIKESTLGPDHPDVAASLNNLAVLHAATGARDEAAAEFDRERRGVRRHVASVLPALSERDQLTFLERTDQNRWHVALSLGRANPEAPRIAAQSAGWLLNGKAVAHEAIARQKLLVRDSRDPAVAAKAAELRAVQSQLAGLSQAAPKQGEEAAHRRRLAELSAQQQELARQVSLAAGRPALEEAWIEPDAVRRALPADGLLVDIVRFRPAIFAAKENEKHWEPARYVAWLTPPAGRGEIEVVDLGPAEAIDAAVALVRAGVAARHAGSDRRARRAGSRGRARKAAGRIGGDGPCANREARRRRQAVDPQPRRGTVAGALGRAAARRWPLRHRGIPDPLRRLGPRPGRDALCRQARREPAGDDGRSQF
jgi:tetratricopeptide (TPR) repeat protein